MWKLCLPKSSKTERGLHASEQDQLGILVKKSGPKRLWAQKARFGDGRFTLKVTHRLQRFKAAKRNNWKELCEGLKNNNSGSRLLYDNETIRLLNRLSWKLTSGKVQSHGNFPGSNPLPGLQSRRTEGTRTANQHGRRTAEGNKETDSGRAAGSDVVHTQPS